MLSVVTFALWDEMGYIPAYATVLIDLPVNPDPLWSVEDGNIPAEVKGIFDEIVKNDLLLPSFEYKYDRYEIQSATPFKAAEPGSYSVLSIINND